MVLHYRPLPSSKDPYYIWNSAGLLESAEESDIIEALDTWTILNAYVYSKINSYNNNVEYYIQWINPQGYIIRTLYDTFRRWILCACVKPVASEVTENLSALPRG